jgi:uncharacterized membrane protein YkoI
MKKKLLLTISVIFALLLVACGGETTTDATENQSATQGEVLSNSGTLYLMVNPEIAIDYDENGLVTDVRAENPEAEEILANYPDYVGKDSGLVLEELIALIGEAGYFVEEVEGESKSIVIELEAGSTLPREDFLERMASNAQNAVETYKSSSEETSATNTQVSYEENTIISLDEAKQIAFDHADVNGENAEFDDIDLESEDGILMYELEFEIGENEYDYYIHALNGDVLRAEQDIEASEGSTDQALGEMISLDEAKQIALDHAGVTAAEARFDDQERDSDDDVLYYEFEFDVGEAEYEYEIHAQTGEILDYEHDLD